MRIALVGEFSSFHKNLAKGLKNLNHTVDIYADGDGWKKVDGATFPLSKKGNNILGKIYGYIFWPVYVTSKIKGYDIVQIISPALFICFLNKILITRIIKNNKRVFLSGAGDCFALEYAYKAGCFRHYIYDDNANQFMKKNFFWNENKEKKLSLKFDGIIPIAWEYKVAYNGYKNRLRAIQIPMDTDEIKSISNNIQGRIVIFHGLNREGPKGTVYIKAAMEKLQHNYPYRVECIIDGKLPLEEYLELMKRTNIVVDQCRGYGIGVNAVYAMAQGKVVLSGAEQESLDVFALKNTPIINILPDENDIYNKLEQLVLHPELIPEIGSESRKMAERFHNCNIVAKRYIEEWKFPEEYRE